MSAQVGVVGTGLIGASVGLAAKRAGMRVCGYDVRSEHAAAALQSGAIESIATPGELYASCEIVVLAMPVSAIVNELHRIRDASTAATLILDAGSVKTAVLDAAGHLQHFVGTHPMAGSERSGPTGARADLFDGRTWAYVPAPNDALNARARSFIASLGGVPVAMTAAEHDARVALTSHLPQTLAALFCVTVGEREDREHYIELFGPAARELARLGRSDATMWRDILAANAKPVATELRHMAEKLATLANDVERNDDVAMAALFASASGLEAK